MVYFCTGSRWSFDVTIFETWRWIYEDFWTMKVLCPCCDKPGKDTQTHLSTERQYSRTRTTQDHDYTSTELRIDTDRLPDWSLDKTNKNNKNIEDCKLKDLAPNKLNKLRVSQDYRKGDIDDDKGDRRRFCWCCIKQRKNRLYYKRKCQKNVQHELKQKEQEEQNEIIQ